MADWMIWGAAACVLVIAEMATGTFYLLMIAIGATAGAIAAFFGVSGIGQCLIAAIVAAIATSLLRRSRFGRSSRIDASLDPAVNQDIGQTLDVEEWHTISGTSHARVMYRGAQWDVELATGGNPVSGTFEIRQILGSRLIVMNQL
jgi:membrane protein implicated in regulation of membrane protease activity